MVWLVPLRMQLAQPSCYDDISNENVLSLFYVLFFLLSSLPINLFRALHVPWLPWSPSTQPFIRYMFSSKEGMGGLIKGSMLYSGQKNWMIFFLSLLNYFCMLFFHKLQILPHCGLVSNAKFVLASVFHWLKGYKVIDCRLLLKILGWLFQGMRGFSSLFPSFVIL